jgi:mycofactocin system glycosyltransferase
MRAGRRLRLDAGVRRFARGRVLVGGEPARMMRLSERGGAVVDAWSAGEAVSGGAAEQLAARLVAAGLAHPQPPPVTDPSAAAVTLVVPVKDDAAGLAQTLAATRPLTTFVVDDGSSRPVQGAGGATVLRNARAIGPAGARERGWRASGADLVAFVDAGVVPRAGWLDHLLAHFDDPAVGAVAPRVVATAGDAPPWLAGYEASHSPLDMGAEPGRVEPRGRVRYVPTAALVVRRPALVDVGGFDASMRYGEDVDLCWRLRRGDWVVRYEPRAVVEHPCRPTLAAWLAQRFAYGSSTGPLAARHGAAVAPFAGLSPWLAASCAAAVLGRPFVAVALAAPAALTIARSGRRVGIATADLAALVLRSEAAALATTAFAIRRAWLPFAVALAWARPRSRLPIALFVVVPTLLDRTSSPRPARPLASAALDLADDLAYQSGVWASCARTRSLVPLAPALGLGSRLRRRAFRR